MSSGRQQERIFRIFSENRVQWFKEVESSLGSICTSFRTVLCTCYMSINAIMMRYQLRNFRPPIAKQAEKPMLFFRLDHRLSSLTGLQTTFFQDFRGGREVGFSPHRLQTRGLDAQDFSGAFLPRRCFENLLSTLVRKTTKVNLQKSHTITTLINNSRKILNALTFFC